MGFPNDDKGMLWVTVSEKTGARLNGQLAPAAGTQIGAGIQGDRLFASYAGFCRYGSQKRTVRLDELKRRRRRHSLLRADPAAETAAGALMRQKRHIIAPGTFGTGGAKKGSRRADAGADPAGCAAFFKMREHPGKAGSGRGFAGFSCVFGELFYFVEQNLPPQCSVGNRFLRKRQEGGSSPSGLCHEQG